MNTMTRLATLIVTVGLASGCPASDKKDLASANGVAPADSKAKSGAVCPVPAKGASDKAAPTIIEGTVVQTLSAGRYVYAELDTGKGNVWVAAPAEPVAKGDKVSCASQTIMEKFESPTLKRTFDRVYFVGSLKGSTGAAAMPAGHPAVASMPAGHGAKATAAPADMKVDVTKAEGGVTISELAERQEKLAGTEVILRAKVIKYNADIMGANWLHVKDGSATRDLTVATKTAVKPGDTVLIRGRLERNIDLGGGYKYDIIIRNAEVTVEK